jgi:hypothetical protein
MCFWMLIRSDGSPCCLSPEVAYGFIALYGRFIGYMHLLRKEDALALDRMVLWCWSWRDPNVFLRLS